MTIILFEGAAGTGKTTRLVGAVAEHLTNRPLLGDERVLALTKFHGSRRRMEERLRRTPFGKVVDCATLDSFAARLVHRRRDLAVGLGTRPTEGDFASISEAASALLRREQVARWVARRYPVIAVDEMQDCKGHEVEILDGLSGFADCFCAADAFQDLSGQDSNDALAWAKTNGSVVSLETNWRTDRTGLVAAGNAVRGGAPVSRGPGFDLVTAPKYQVAGGTMSWKVKSWSPRGGVAVISPTGPGTSPFVDGALNWIASKPAKSKHSSATAGPFVINWESGDRETARALAEALGLNSEDGSSEVLCSEMAEMARRTGAPELSAYLRRLQWIAGRRTVTTEELRGQIDRIIHRRRAFSPETTRRRFALTVHQAKNREFYSVIVLWPMRLTQDTEQQRRLLYNAITRAQRQAVVIVEDPRRNRLSGAPFSMGVC